MRPTHVISLYKLLRSQWANPERIREIQEDKLKKLVHHAYLNVPYYRRLFDSEGIKPKDIRRLEDLSILPVTPKSKLQELSLQEKTAYGIDLQKCRTFVTSGTTAVPLMTFFTRGDTTLRNLSWVRACLGSGMKPWHRIVAFMGERQIDPAKPWYEYLGIWRRKKISTWTKPEEWIKQIREWKPQVFIGYVMTVRILAETILEKGTTGINPKFIFLCSGVLDESSRRLFETVFSSTVIDIYGSDEAGCIAWECKECCGYHIAADMLIVEVLKNKKPASPGEEGEVVVTDLHSFAMPFIRYKQEDIVLLSGKKSRCGRGFPLLEAIQGRYDDFIVLGNGATISSHPVYHAVGHVTGVRRWRVVQKTLDTLLIEIETTRDFPHSGLRTIENNMRNLTANQIENIQVSTVPSIAISSNAKFRAVMSKVARPW